MISDVERTHKNIKRAGITFLYDVFLKYTVFKDVLRGEDALKIHNSLGLSLSTIVLLANSHYMTVDEQKFLELLEEQKEQMYKSRQC